MSEFGHEGLEETGGHGDGAWTRRPWPLLGIAALLLVGLGLGLGFGLSGGGAAAATGPEGVPIQKTSELAPADTTASGSPIDGISCVTSAQERVEYHVHAHISIFVNGQQRRLPAGAGIAAPRAVQHLANGAFVDNSVSGCLYWIHVHVDDGIIHVEAPSKQAFTLGQFFDVWQQPLSVDRVGPAGGTVVAYENGRRFAGNPRDIPLLPDATIQLDVGKPVVPFQPVQFKVTGGCGGTEGCSASPG